ncbi:MAG: aldo/keto reductase [Solirubrobacteraceae bacterium]|nr:aldo/keto reductase [Solirubrobacteraceae bacterium]
MPDSTSTKIPELLLNTGARIPQLGFGVWEIPADDAERVVSQALEAGFRHIDTAAAYENEEGVGRAIAASGIPRDELFVTTKLWNRDHGTEEAKRAIDASLEKLGLDHVDLYLIHWPVPSQDRFVETWQALETFNVAGLAKAVGVSNFTEQHLERVLNEGTLVPAANQIEVHPLNSQISLRAWHGERGILTEAWSPLAQSRLNDDPAVTKIAEAHGVDVGQVLLRWNLHLGNVVLSRSKTPERIRSNAQVLGFELTTDEIATISALDQGSRGGPDPETFKVGAQEK